MRSRWSAVAVVLAAIAAHTACVEGLEFTLTGSSSSTSSTGTGGQGGSGAASSSVSSGGSGAASSTTSGTGGGCMSPADCPGIESLCRHKTCGAGICDSYLEPSGTEVTPAAGDCKKRQCNSSGAIVVVADQNDPYFDGNECTLDACDMMTMTPVNSTVPEQTPCNGGMGYCCSSVYCNLTPQGMACHECHPDLPGTCPMATPVCQKGKCVPSQCTNTMKDPNEGGPDCGGPCALCPDGAACTLPADCESQVCSGTPKTCAAPTCMDNKKNGKETGIDCGGGCPSKCPDTFACVFPSDCESNVCLMNQCKMATCMDGVQNGGEMDIDCGGNCAACP